MSRSPKAPLYMAIAARLADDIKAMLGPRLPPQRRLYTRYGVSQATMRAAIGVLGARGIVETTAPGRIRICGREEAPVPERMSAEESVCRQIRAGMVECRYRDGDALPKMAAVAAELAVSTHSVLRAYHRLGREGVLHRRGKSWIVGRPRVEAAAGPWKSLIVLTNLPASWNGLDTAPRTRGFCMAFSREAQLHRTLMVTASTTLGNNRTPSFLSGTDSVIQKIGELGAGFTGILVAASRNEAPDLGLLAAHLHKLRRPLVWFDRIDEGRGAIAVPTTHAGRTTPWFTRCYFDEEAAVRLALDRLARAGHRTVGYLYHGRDRWIRSRLGMVKKVADELGERAGVPLRIVAHPHDKLLQASGDAEDVYGRLQRILREGPPVAAGVLRRMTRRVSQRGGGSADRASLSDVARRIAEERGIPAGFTKDDMDTLTYASLCAPYLRDPEITALIAPNDAKAFLYYRQLSRLGVSVPGTLSLVSFDNYVPDQPNYPITTVDFGFDTLGYAAFHAIMGDLPVNRTRRGDIPAMPRLVERGSIGAPRQNL